MKSRTNLGGFTLIEMMITVVIIGIIAAMAAPSFKAQIAKRKMEDDMHKLEICFKESQLKAFTYKTPITVRINGASSELTCGNDSTPIKLSSSVSLGSDVDVTTTFAPNMRVYSNYDTVLIDDSKQTSANRNNIGFQFCMSGLPKSTLIINSRGLVTMNPFGEGAICN